MSYGFTTYAQDTFSSSGSTNVVISVTGVTGTGQIGNASAGQFVTVLPTGVQAQAKEGKLGEFVSGVFATASIGPYSIATEGNVVIVLETPVTGTTQLGNETLSLDCVLTMTGVQANASLNSVDFKIDTVAKPRQDEDFVITVKSTGSGNKYVVNGIQQQMPTALHKGFTYKFDQSDSSNNNHPMRFSTTDNGSWNGGSEYTDGVTVVGTPGQAGAYTQITVADNAPSQLYTYCLNHSGMGFGVTVGENAEIKGNANLGTGTTISLGATVFPTKVSASTAIGTVSISLSADVDVVGVFASVSTSNVLVWSEIDTNQDPNWTEIAA
tara:strand:- start:2565 stop:3539 length:975 start_codon:yes stop_codon:yes gene_type:complete